MLSGLLAAAARRDLSARLAVCILRKVTRQENRGPALGTGSQQLRAGAVTVTGTSVSQRHPIIN